MAEMKKGKTLEELLVYYGINEQHPITVINGNTTMEVDWRYLKGGWEEVLERKVSEYGKDMDTGRIIFILEEEP